VNYLDERNAAGISRWEYLRRTGAVCGDPWHDPERLWFDFNHARNLAFAREWLVNRTVQRTNNKVIPMRVRR
jgi:hypothetical protein